MDYYLELEACQGDKDSLPTQRPKALPLAGESGMGLSCQTVAIVRPTGTLKLSSLQSIFELTYKIKRHRRGLENNTTGLGNQVTVLPRPYFSMARSGRLIRSQTKT